ncbi:MAG: AGE family epimerase/isomerase [Cyclobacteriaceae bacterium]|nr:AGE family epimerase/isomerase [Cyclobacteriaceae bacterium]
MNGLYRMVKCFFLGMVMFFSGIFMSCINSEDTKANKYLALATQMEEVFLHTMLEVWYPAFIDSIYGGYLSNFDYNWKAREPQNKFIVTQTRHIWTTSEIVHHYPDRNLFLDYAMHGFDFLQNHLWDRENGGFYQLTDREGNLLSDEKRAYGNAFGIYGLAALYKVSENDKVLAFAKDAFYWFDQHAHDSINGGYFEYLSQDGTPLYYRYPSGQKQFEAGIKDFNSSIHILEAFSELYMIWPNDLLKQRLEEMFYIIRDTFVGKKGYLSLFFTPDWQEITDDLMHNQSLENMHDIHITFGHDIETVFLLTEAARALEIPFDDTFLNYLKMMADQVIDHGWDEKMGGIFERGKWIDGSILITDSTKVWWSQAEAMNTLLLMSTLIPEKQTYYFELFVKSWSYINDYMIDHKFGGWYPAGIDGTPAARTAMKAQIWKGTYHDGRAMLRCIETLKHLGKS